MSTQELPDNPLLWQAETLWHVGTKIVVSGSDAPQDLFKLLEEGLHREEKACLFPEPPDWQSWKLSVAK